MNKEIAGSKWIEGIYPDTPCVLAARTVLALRLTAVERMMELTTNPPDDDPEYVHQLRVSSRRADAAMKLFRPFFPSRATKRTRRALRIVRKAAAMARSDDVQIELLGREASKTPADARHAVRPAQELISKDRKRIQEMLQSACKKFARARVQPNLLKELILPRNPGTPPALSGTSESDAPPYSLGALSDALLPPLIDTFVKDVQADFDDAAALHRLRIASKKLRYALEIVTPCLPRDASASAYRELVKMQSRLGRINDYFELTGRLQQLAAKMEKSKGGRPEGNGAPGGSGLEMAALAEFYRSQFERSSRRFLHWFDALRQRKTVDAVMALIPPPHAHSPARESAGRRELRSTDRSNRLVSAGSPPSTRHRRVAAIDVGTNSIRMAVAETDPAIGFRIIEDVKETTRLGTGVFRSGKLKVGAVKRSLSALQRMRTIAESYKVDSLRAVATSAVREAANGIDFVKLIRRRVGIPIEVIQPQREARLAFSGVARDFELADHRIAVVDTGGGSTELIFASSAVIDAIRPIPLGAVRLTETFQNPDEPGGYSYGEMRRRIEKEVKKTVRRMPYRPEFIVGAGGTFTSLARVALREGEGDGKSGRFPFAVRGCELRHKTVLRVLNELRRMTLEERCRVPGISAKRAEIIVAGLCIVERLMEYLRVDRLFIHDGGIRDGLVAEMIDELGFRCLHPRTHPEQVLGAVARYAERMKYPREHSEHVANLSVKIFDALKELQPDAAGTWAKPAHRDLLRCSALLHDVGRRISRKSHHKHAYDMILHADLATLTRREIEIIANVCRYHRKSGPKRGDPNLRKLGADDQRLVAHLVGILRVADGLDYSQKQNVTDVFVSLSDGETVFEVTAAGDPLIELKRAASKADVFESTMQTKVRCTLRASARALVTV